ncbi:restriction endonuclease subunit S [Enterococcus faecium]|uniref:restriction endonuclease subunit S n=2 Tax=Enterococcus faecium TaxID=1352 RepID=UPI00338D8F95
MSNDTQPEIRFPGFTDDWEQRKFQWLIDQNIIDSPIDGNHGEKHPKSSDYVESGIPFLMAKDIKNNKVDIKNCTFISKETAGALDKGFAKNGDILLTHKATIGEVGILEGVNTEYAMLTPQITYYRILDFSRLDRNFFSSVLRSSVFQKNIHKIAKQSTRPYVGITEQRKLTIYFPIKIEEQQKIGTFFKQLDDTIALHQRKLDLLKETKKGFLQKMFPKNGAKVPEIRFPGFTEDWEERRLQEVVDRYDNLRIPITASKRVAGNTPYYGANGIQGYVEGYTHDGEFILVAEDGANDLKNYPVQYVDGKVWVNNHAHVIQAKENLADNMFLMNAIRSINIEPFLVGGGRAKLNADVLMKLEVIIPLKSEQQKIGNFFKQLDDTITLHQRKLDLLKEMKKGFLQKMFV